MRLSQLMGNRYKERPADAATESYAFLLRGGHARVLTNGIYALLPPGARVQRKIEAILRSAFETLGAQEIRMPSVRPRDGEEPYFEDRSGRALALSARNDAAVAALCRGEFKSYTQLPFIVYAVGDVFRDGAARGGLLQARAFPLLEAYGFHAAQVSLLEAHTRFQEACLRAFARMGLPEAFAADADPGAEDAPAAHAFVLPCGAGEDVFVACESCGYRALRAAARGRVPGYPSAPLPLEKVHTPGMKTIKDVAACVGVETWQAAKAVLYDRDAEGRLVMLVIRGDIEANEAKLERLIGAEPVPASEERILACGATPGFATAMGLDPAKCRVIVDHSISESNNLVCGANEADWHYKNFNLARDLPGAATVDAALVPDGAVCIRCGGVLRHRPGIVLGSAAQIGTRFTGPLDVTFTDEQGGARTPLMGRCAVGVSRVLCAAVEAYHDKYGPKWAMSIAPWQAHLHALKANDPELRGAADRLYAAFEAAGIETLYDDRNLSPGVQFADADLIGAPIRLIVSGRHLANGQVEYKRRDTGETGTLGLDSAVDVVRQWVAAGMASG